MERVHIAQARQLVAATDVRQWLYEREQDMLRANLAGDGMESAVSVAHFNQNMTDLRAVTQDIAELQREIWATMAGPAPFLCVVHKKLSDLYQRHQMAKRLFDVAHTLNPKSVALMEQYGQFLQVCGPPYPGAANTPSTPLSHLPRLPPPPIQLESDFWSHHTIRSRAFGCFHVCVYIRGPVAVSYPGVSLRYGGRRGDDERSRRSTMPVDSGE